MGKQKFFFIPTYIGPLKHYARFIPYLKHKYHVGFLIIRPDSHRRQEMIQYCREQLYTCHVIDEGLSRDDKIRIPFLTPLKKRYDHSLACRRFLETVKPAKIISHKAWSPYDTIFKEANRLGIETIVLQWSSDAGLTLRGKRRLSLARKIYLFVLRILSALLDVWYQEPRFGYAPATPKKIGVFYEERRREYIAKGYDPGTVHLVGSPDSQLASELKKKVDSSPSLQEELLRKYGLTKDKLKILVILHRFYLVSDERYRMTIAEHVNHYYGMFKAVREIFSRDEADIMLKVHPTENPMHIIYQPYEDLGVKIFHGEAKTDELLCLSDLYVAEPASTANYLVLGTGTPAIFVNLSPWQIINERAKYFHIKQVISDKNEFVNMLRRFKRGTLKRQYDNATINLNSLDKTIELINQ